MATVGFEASLVSGSADLVLLDGEGRVCIVEVKKEGNPDTRRVVAQLLDYAAALWGLTVDEFERDVLRHKLGDEDPRALRDFILDELVADAEDPEDAAERALEGLGETLRTGNFALVLAAPAVPPSVERVIEYLNARGLSFYAVEVSYFSGDVEAFVPRVVVRPSLGTRIAGQDARASTPIDPEQYIAALPEPAQDPVRTFTSSVESIGGELQWWQHGPRVRVVGENGPKIVVSLDAEYLWITLGHRKGLDPQYSARAAERLRQIPAAKLGKDYGSVKWSSAGSQIEAGLEVARTLVNDLVNSTGHQAVPQSTASGEP